VQRLTEAHNGTVSVENAAGGGALFRVQLKA
jgi:signal transduction histidine kinase